MARRLLEESIAIPNCLELVAEIAVFWREWLIVIFPVEHLVIVYAGPVSHYAGSYGSEYLEVLEILVQAGLVWNAVPRIPLVFQMRAQCDELPHLVKR